MRVITDIITYLAGRGMLGADDLDYLRRQGFLPPSEEFPPAVDDEPPADLSGQTPAEDLADHIDRRGPARRARGGRPPARAKVDGAQISGKLLAAWPQWEAHMAGLAAFANLVGPAPSLKLGLQLLQRASHADLDAAVAHVLASPAEKLGELWAGLAFDAYRSGIVPDHASGPAIRAYRTVLAGAGRAATGAHRRELRLAGFALLLLLVQAQRAVLAAFGRCLADRPELFDRRLFSHRGYDRVCYWSLTYAVSALHRLRPEALPLDMHRAKRRPLADDGAAWACAAAMNGPAVAAFLADHAGRGAMLYCPKTWDAGYRHIG